MKHVRSKAMALSTALLSASCVDHEPRAEQRAGASESDSGLVDPGQDVSGYFIVTRIDTRRCLFPICGGVFVKHVNKALTVCGDGVPRKECHAAVTDVSALGLPEEQEQQFLAAFEQSKALVRGKLADVNDPSLPAPVSTLFTSEGWKGAAQSIPTGRFSRLSDSGIVCITFPCPSFLEQVLNTRRRRELAEVDLAASGAKPELVDAGYQELFDTGILAAGTHFPVTGPAGTMPGFRASEFYLRVRPDANTCSLSADTCPEGHYCAIPEGLCAQGSGTCEVQPEHCLFVWDPVCGCDGQTYSNAGCAAVAGVSVAHQGECGCAPMDAVGVGPCDAFFGYAFDGERCQAINGCSCEGTDCDALFSSLEDCEAKFEHCMS